MWKPNTELGVMDMLTTCSKCGQQYKWFEMDINAERKLIAAQNRNHPRGNDAICPQCKGPVKVKKIPAEKPKSMGMDTLDFIPKAVKKPEIKTPPKKVKKAKKVKVKAKELEKVEEISNIKEVAEVFKVEVKAPEEPPAAGEDEPDPV